MTIKLEFFAPDSRSTEPPVILLYGGTSSEAQLRDVFRVLASRIHQRVALDELPFVESVRDCRLLAAVSDHDLGVAPDPTGSRFEWTMTPASWDNSESLLQPFIDRTSGSGGFQYLNRGIGPQVIYSTRRSW